MEETPRRRRIGRVIGVTVIALVAVLCLAIPLTGVVLNGDRLGGLVTRFLPRLELDGQIAAKGISLSPRLLVDFINDRPTPVVVEGLRITDPEGVEVLWAPRVEVSIRPRAAIDLKIILSHLVLSPGTRWRFAEMKKRPEIGFLAAFAFKDQPPATPSSEPSGFVFQITDARLQGLEARFDFPPIWGLALHDVRTGATASSVLVEGDFVGWSVPGLEVKAGGFLEVLGERLPWDRIKVRKAETTRQRPDDIFLDIETAETGASRLTARGWLRHIYGFGVPEGAVEPPTGIDMQVRIDDLAPALRAVAAPHAALAGLQIAGRGATVQADLKGPFEALQLAGQLRGLDLDYQGHAAKNLRSTFSLDLGTPMRVEVKTLEFAGASGGQALLAGKLRGSSLSARLQLRHFGTQAYLPPGARATLAGQLEGRLALTADIAKPALSIDDVDLRLLRSQRDRRSPPGEPLRLKGRARATPQAASTEGLTFELPGAVITAQGRYGLAHQMLGIGLRATAAQLPRLLQTFGLPPLAKSAVVELDVAGQLTNPTARGTIAVQGLALGSLPPIDALQARLALDAGVAKLESLRAEAFAGVIEAAASVRLWQRSFLRPIRSPALTAQVNARGIDLAKLLPGADMAGRLDVLARAEGTPAAFQAKLTVPGQPTLTLLGERWKLLGCELEADAQTLFIRRARLERLGGGVLELAGRADWAGPVKVGIKIEGVPLGGLPGLASAGIPIEGRLSAHLDVRGTYKRPLVEGDVSVERVSIRGIALGNGRVTLHPTESGGVAARGDLFERFVVGGEVNYGDAGPIITARGQFRNVLIETFFPELVDYGEARGRLTGQVDFSYGGANPMTVDLRLSELELSAARDIGAVGAGRRPGRLSIRNATPIRVILKGQHLVVDRTRLVTQGGDLKLWGEIKDDLINAELAGALDLELLHAFLGNRVESVGGEVDLALRLHGTPKYPQGDGNLTIVRPIAVRFPEIAPVIRMPSGTIKLDAGALSLANVVVEAEGAQLRLGGRAWLGGKQHLKDLDFSVSGDVSGALLEALSQGAISEATGKARVDGLIQGSADAPQVKARVDLTGLGFHLPDVGRDIAMEGGVIDLSGLDIVIRDLRARVDGHGEFLLGVAPEAAGRISLRGAWPAPKIGPVKLPVRGQRISLRVSNAVELDDIGLDVDISGDPDRGFALDGEITVASGRYVRDYNVRELVITPSIDESEVEPFYAGNALLEKLMLRLRLRTLGDSFVVQNNLVPELHVSFDLEVKGTLAQPRIAGLVRPTEGQFHLFGVKQNFELVPNVNQITFVETKSLERGETPELNLEMESLVTDHTGRDHLVRMRVTGPVRQAHIDLSTDTGLDRSQALLLVVSGRTGEVVGGLNTTGAGNASASSLGSGGSDVVGQLLSDILEPYIDGPMQKLTQGKLLLRPTVGPQGLELRLDARLSRQFDLHATYQRGLETRDQLRLESNLWLMDYVSLGGLYQKESNSSQQGLVEESSATKLNLSIDFPIRLFLR